MATKDNWKPFNSVLLYKHTLCTTQYSKLLFTVRR